MKTVFLFAALLISPFAQAEKIYSSEQFSEASRFIEIPANFESTIEKNACMEAAIVSIVGLTSENANAARAKVLSIKAYELLQLITITLESAPKVTYLFEIKDRSAGDTCQVGEATPASGWASNI